MVKTQTTVNIDSEKKDIAKKRGIKLSDLLDQALDMALGLELKESVQLQNEKEDLINDKKILLKEKDDFLKDHENKISVIDFKLKNIDEALSKAVLDDKEEIKEKEYNILLDKGFKMGGIEDNELMGEIEEFADKYKLNDVEFDDLQQKLIHDINEKWANSIKKSN